ncbi:MAG: hypothetical protein JWQ63_4391 [Mucilaginibacter sp.]|nr:hypothetical protein [Mucilaginibacter sp.]
MKYEDLDEASEKIFYEEIIVCLFDGNYNLGAGALINSLVKADFKGLIYIGYRGALPIWVKQLKPLGNDNFSVTPNINIHFKQVDTQMHLGYYKPFFIKEAFDNYKQTKKIYYFDVDIIVKAPWTVFSNWLESGLCLCLDNSFHFLHNSHPWRKHWIKLAPQNELSFNDINYYFNSGFIGIERDSIIIIDRWIYYTNKYIEVGGNVNRFVKDEFNHLKGDQDLLNAAITISPNIEISIVGKEGMGFTTPATLMLHAIGDNKPWSNLFFIQLIKSGNKPNLADKYFFSYCKYPINIFAGYKYQLKKLDMLISALLGRVIG